MYTRFVVPQHDPYSGVEGGIFRIIGKAMRDPQQPLWLRQQLDADLTWFNDQLPVPDRLWLQFKRRRPRFGICWFLPTAQTAIARARSIQWTLIEAGYPVAQIHSDHPGTVYYRDHWQVVAQAGGHVPTGFN